MRKRAIAALAAAFAMNAQADESEVAGFRNNAGGMTIITSRDQYCGRRAMNDGYAFAADGRYARFCWIARSGAVLAVFEDGTIQQWHSSVFELLAEEPEINNNKP